MIAQMKTKQPLSRRQWHPMIVLLFLVLGIVSAEPMPIHSDSMVWGIDGNFLNRTRGIPSSDNNFTGAWGWIPTTTVNAPSARWGSAAVWTGTEMIVWGGGANQNLNTGGRYNPASNTWKPTSVVNAPEARIGSSAVWDGGGMIIWGGAGIEFERLNTGGRYAPNKDTWTTLSTINAPEERAAHTTIWTGSEMVIWGGYGVESVYDHLNTGGHYNPVTNKWKTTSLVNAPTVRSHHTAVWTGSEMIVWGGDDKTEMNFHPLNTGGRYNPVTGAWTPLPTDNAPSARAYHAAVWTGSEMIVWGGQGAGNAYLSSGGRYNPVTNTWRPTSNIGNQTRAAPSAVWTGSDMIVWGGFQDGVGTPSTGWRYNPITDIWTALSNTNAPVGRIGHTAVWTGSEMIIWAGARSGYEFLNTGGRYLWFSSITFLPLISR